MCIRAIYIIYILIVMYTCTCTYMHASMQHLLGDGPMTDEERMAMLKEEEEKAKKAEKKAILDDKQEKACYIVFHVFVVPPSKKDF